MISPRVLLHMTASLSDPEIKKRDGEQKRAQNDEQKELLYDFWLGIIHPGEKVVRDESNQSNENCG